MDKTSKADTVQSRLDRVGFAGFVHPAPHTAHLGAGLAVSSRAQFEDFFVRDNALHRHILALGWQVAGKLKIEGYSDAEGPIVFG